MAMACCVRINSALIRARAIIMPENTKYMMPIFLWSRLVIHPVHI